jgi:bacterioferritin (cytochrome b1)
MEKLAQHNREKFVDLLSERLAFERATIELYDSVLTKMRRLRDPVSIRLIAPLEDFREHEKEHTRWLEEVLRQLGATGNERTGLTELAWRESSGIERAIRNDEEAIHLVHALLSAELVDNAGWELLLELADEADDEFARREFLKRLHEEKEHLFELRRAMLSVARKEILGSLGGHAGM